MMKGIDTAARIRKDKAIELVKLGFTFVGRYCVPMSGSLTYKAMTLDEANEIRSAGLAIMPIWETTAERAKTGYSGGVADGIAAEKRAKELGIPVGTVIYFTVDYNAPESDFISIEQYFRAAKWNVGAYKLGIYAPSNVLRSIGSICDKRWLMYAWNCGNAQYDVKQTHYQGNKEALAVGEAVGFAVDLDEAKSLDGMWRAYTTDDAALEWAKKNNITDDPALALAFWKYNEYTKQT